MLEAAPPPGLPDDAGRVAEALNRLPERDREAILLIAWEGLAPRQAAAVLGVTPAVFSVRLHRARRRVRAVLEPDDPATVELAKGEAQ
jgi:RNA polymerase sigma-70 factor (ECF subfamily)